MSFPRQEPLEGVQKIQTWTYVKSIPKGGINAHLAGQTEWVECHHSYRSIPCYWIMSHGALQCPWCKVSPRTDWMGYVPLYSEIGAPIVVGVRKHMRDALKTMDFFSSVKVLKGDTKFGKVGIVRHPTIPPLVPSREQAANPVDLRDWLLVLWKEPVLSSWVRAQSDNPVSQQKPPVRVTETGDGRKVIDADYAELVKRVAKRAAELPTVGESLNGKHSE